MPKKTDKKPDKRTDKIDKRSSSPRSNSPRANRKLEKLEKSEKLDRSDKSDVITKIAGKASTSYTPTVHPTFDLDQILNAAPPMGVYGSATRSTGSTSNTTNTAKPLKPTKISNAVGAPDMSKYVEVDKSQWTKLLSNTFIRYIDVEGNWRPGARVKSIKVTDEGNEFTIGKFNPVAKKFTMWNVKFSNVSKLYKLVEANKSTTNPIGAPVAIKAGGVDGGNDPSDNNSNDVDADHKNDTREEQILDKLGNKLLFDDGAILKHKVENLEADLQRMSEDQKSLLILIKRLHARLERAGIPL